MDVAETAGIFRVNDSPHALYEIGMMWGETIEKKYIICTFGRESGWLLSSTPWLSNSCFGACGSILKSGKQQQLQPSFSF